MNATAKLPDTVLDVFNAVIAQGMDARIDTAKIGTTAPEFNVVITNPYRGKIGGHGRGLLHEEIATLLRIAEQHGARLWWGFEDEPCILWPGDMPRGPVGQETTAAEERRAARNGFDGDGKPKTRAEAVAS